MQIFELILYILTILFVGILVLKIKLRNIHFLMYIFLYLTVFIFHLIFDDYRWQLIILYVLMGLLITYINFNLFKSNITFKFRKRMLVTLIVFIFVSVSIVYAFPVYDMPLVSGDYSIGTESFTIIDDSRFEIYSDNPNEYRRFKIQTWYPIDSTIGYEQAPWLQDGIEVSRSLSKDTNLPGFLLDHTTNILSNSYLEAPIKDIQEKYPVVIISHGWRGFRNLHTDFAEELASQGFFVVSIDHTYGSVATVFSDDDVAYLNLDALPERETTPNFLEYANDLVNTYAYDVIATIDYLEIINNSNYDGLLDLSKIGLLGHSTGGGGDVTAALLDDRVDAIIGLDAWVEPIETTLVNQPLTIPSLFLRSGQWETGFNNTNLFQLVNNSSESSYLYQIDGTTHYDFSMVYMYSPLTRLIGFTGSVKGDYLNDILETMIVDFFNQTLRNEMFNGIDISDWDVVRSITSN